jgi:hypothetical protein
MAKFTVSNGVLYLGGQRCAEIGINAYSLGEKTWGQATPDNAYLTSFPLIKSYGYNVVRIMAAPFGGTGTYGWGNVVGSTPPTTWNDLNSGYRSKIDAIMDAAGNNGLTVIAACLWNPPAVPDMLGETLEQAFTPGSSSLAYWEAFASVFADHFKNHDAYGAHSPFNEWPAEGIRGFAPPFPAPQVWSAANVRGACERIWAAMRAADASRIVIPAFIAPPIYNDAFRWEWFRGIDDSILSAGRADVLDWHVYLSSTFVGEKMFTPTTPTSPLQVDPVQYENFVGLKELLTEARRRAASRGKPFVMTEFGVNSYQDPSSVAKITELVTAIKNAGVQLALMWDWNPRTSLVVPNQDRWSIYPGYIDHNGYARGDNYLAAVTNENVNPSTVPSVSAQVPPRCARFSGASNSGVSIPASARYQTAEMTIMGWIRMRGRPAAFSRIAQYRNAAATAGWLWLFDAPANFSYMEWRKASGSAESTAGDAGRRPTNRWYHVAISFSNTETQLFLDGREFRYFTYANAGWVPHDGTTNLFLGYDGTTNWGRFDMAEFGLFNRRVSADEIFQYVFYGNRPATPVGWWPLQNNANDDSGFGNNGTALSALTFVDTQDARAAITQARTPRA